MITNEKQYITGVYQLAILTYHLGMSEACNHTNSTCVDKAKILIDEIKKDLDDYHNQLRSEYRVQLMESIYA